MRMRRVHLSIRTEGITAFSKRKRRCSVDGENDTKTMSVTQICLKTEQTSSVFVWKRIRVDIALVLGILGSYLIYLKLKAIFSNVEPDLETNQW